MPLIINCEKCGHLYETVGFTKPDGTTDGQGSKCPRCGNWNGLKHFFDQFLKTKEKKD